MSALVEMTQFGARTNSRVVAEVFEKEHKNVLAAIDGLLELKPALVGQHFQPDTVVVPTGFGDGRAVRAFEMDRDGFTLLAMGFTGAKALDWKLAFIEAFNRMEREWRDAAAERTEAEPQVMRDYSPALAVIREARQIFAAKDVRALWPRLGLPDPFGRSVTGERLPPPVEVEGSIARWRDACTADDPDATTSARELWDSYREWCEREGVAAVTQTSLGRTLAALGYEMTRSGGGYIHRVGLKLTG